MPFSRDDMQDKLGLLEVVRQVKPTMLFGLSTAHGAFTKEIIMEVTKHCERPYLCPMSNPTSQAECTAEEAVEGSDGKAIIATGSPFDPVVYKGKTYYASQGNNVSGLYSCGTDFCLYIPQLTGFSLLFRCTFSRR